MIHSRADVNLINNIGTATKLQHISPPQSLWPMWVCGHARKGTGRGFKSQFSVKLVSHVQTTRRSKKVGDKMYEIHAENFKKWDQSQKVWVSRPHCDLVVPLPMFTVHTWVLCGLYAHTMWNKKVAVAKKFLDTLLGMTSSPCSEWRMTLIPN